MQWGRKQLTSAAAAHFLDQTDERNKTKLNWITNLVMRREVKVQHNKSGSLVLVKVQQTLNLTPISDNSHIQALNDPLTSSHAYNFS